MGGIMDLKKITLIVLVILLMVISVTKVSPWTEDPENHRHSIEQTEDKISVVMELAAVSAGASALVSLIPGDACTPIAEQLAEFTKYFLLILSALYLEKYLICLSGFVTFTFIIPIAGAFFIAWLISKKESFKAIAAKVLLFGIVVYLIVPASVMITDGVYKTQAESIEHTLDEYNDLDLKEGSTLREKLTNAASSAVEKLSVFLRDLLESLAVMVVTACLIPLLAFVILVWFIKTLFTNNVLKLDADSAKKLISFGKIGQKL